MSVEQKTIQTREQWLAWRAHNVNASEAACLWGEGVHPYLSPYRLWALRSGLIGEDPDSPEKRRGRLLEPVAIELLKEERPSWRVEPCRLYCFDPDARLGATPDVKAIRPDRAGVGTVQIKTVGHWAFARNWRDKETSEVELPTWIAVQASVEAHLIGAEWAAVAVMALGDGGLDFHLVDVPLKPELIVTLKEYIADFWRRVRDHDPYPVDWRRDVATLLKLYADDDGSIVDLTDDAAFGRDLIERETLKAVEKTGEAAHERRRVVDARIIAKMQNASGARFGPTLITAKTIRVKEKMIRGYTFRRIAVKGDAGAAAAA